MSTTKNAALVIPAAPLGDISLTDREFDLLRELIQSQAGIHLGPHKREMLKARLMKRLRALGLTSFFDYHRYLLDQDVSGEERVRFINAMTTNVTDFFREEHHFEHLRHEWLPALRARASVNGKRTLRIWSAGCSTGEEPYSIAITVRDVLGAAADGWDIRLLASDIDSDAVRHAAAGVYPRGKVDRMPAALLSRYFLRGVGLDADWVRVRSEIQQWITFRRISLTEEPWPIHTRFDAIFCRNVLIYFDAATQTRVLQRLLAYLHGDGLLFLGHSEGLHGLLCGLQQRAQTVYQRQDARD